MQTQKPTRVRYVVMAFLCSLSFLTYFDRVSIMRAQSEIQADLHLDLDQLGYVLGAFWLAYGIFEIPSGWFGDSAGPRKTLLRIVIAWSLFTALTGTATGFISLIACRFLFGAGEAGAYPNMAAIQSRWLPKGSRARAGGLLWLFARWGGAFSPLIFGAITRGLTSPESLATQAALPKEAAKSFVVMSVIPGVTTWRLGFFISGALGVAWCIAFFSWFRDNPADKASVNQAELDLIAEGKDKTQAAHNHAAGKEVWAALFASPSLWALAGLYFCANFGWSFFVSWMPRYFEKIHNVTFEKSELISALPLFCGGITCLLGGWISDIVVRRTGWRRMGRAMFPVFGCTVAAAAMYGIHYTTTPAQAITLMCIAEGAYDFGQAANWATIVDIGGKYSGTATGFINMIGNFAQFIQPTVGAMIIKTKNGWDTLFFVYSAAFIAAATMWLFIDPRRPFYEPRKMATD